MNLILSPSAIFFSMKGQTLQIMRILHGQMDFNRHLVDGFPPG